MRVQFSCECGQQYSAKVEMVGKCVRCRKCNCIVTTPGNDSLWDDDDESLPNIAPTNEAAWPELAKHEDTLANSQYAEPGIQSWLKDQLVEGHDRDKVDSFFGLLIPGNLRRLVIGLAIASLVVGISYLVQRGMKGPTFLLFYAASLALIWVISELLRTRDDSADVTIPAALAFLGIGVVRYAYGVNHGMHRFTFLFMMMAIGSVLILVGVKRLLGAERGDNWPARVGVPIGVCAIAPLVLLFGPLLLILGVVFVLSFVRRHRGQGGSSGGCSGGSCSGGSCGGGGGCGGGCGGGGCGG